MGKDPASPKLSVIVPVFNGARTISQTLKSLQDQTMTDIEVIVVDDGSTDMSYNIARAFGERDPRIWAISLGANFGAAIAVNTGMLNSSGKYVATLAADDYWLEDAAEKFVRTLDENPTAHGAYSDWIVWYEADGIKEIQRAPAFDRALLRRGDYINFSAFVARWPIWLDSDWEPVSDWDYLMHLTKHWHPPLVRLPMVLAVRRVHSAQVSAGLGGAKMMWKRLLLPYHYDTFLGATRTALRHLRGAVWRITRAPKL